MSVNAYDLGRRLRAAHDQRPVPNLAHTPALPPREPVAVLIPTSGNGQIHAATADARASADGPEALNALLQLGIGLTEQHRTLVVTDRASLDTLVDLAHRCAWHPTLAPVAAAVAWWAGRAEHPGSSGVLVLTEALRRRWTLGTPADQERDLATWATWLHTSSTGTGALLELADAVTTGAPPFPGLQTMDSQDVASWEWHREHPTSWTQPDSRSAAALGLITRCDAADLYASFQLDDPLVASRAIYSGEVVAGQVTGVDPTLITADQPLSRLRADSDVEGWIGEPSERNRTSFAAHIDTAGVDPSGALVLTISPSSRRIQLAIGARVTLRPRRIDPFQQSGARRQRRHRQSAPSNWLATRNCPPPARREVPLDIAIAAADD